MIGIRGVPANYGGLETCAEEVGARLVERGHEVIVYCRKGTYDDRVSEYKGIRRIVLPSIKTKITDTYVHSFLSMLHVLTQRPDVILAFNPALGSLCLIPRAFGFGVALNPNGFDWKRKKWGLFARFFIRRSAWLCTRVVNQMVIDAVSVRDCYNSDFGCTPPAIYIPNGANLELRERSEVSEEDTQAILSHYGVEKDKYVLFLSRHVPENSCEHILRAFGKVTTDAKLFFGGSGAYGDRYAEDLKQYASDRILFPGAVYDPAHVKVLHHNCQFLINGNQPGGTSLGLLKSLGYGTCTMAVNTPDNAYALKNAGVVFELDDDDLAARMQELLDDPDLIERYRGSAVERIKEEYLWEVVVDKYEQVLKRLAGKKVHDESAELHKPVSGTGRESARKA